MNDTTNHFAQLAAINVNDRLEQKNGLSYLSWAWAVDQLLRLDPKASWTYAEHDGVPFIGIGDTAMVFCTVTAFGIARTAQLPVMDHRNKCIPNPDAFAVNTAMQRALVKAIALHGLGLYVYAGEDLPAGQEPTLPQEVADALRACTTLDDLRAKFRLLDKDQRKLAMPLVDEIKAKLSQAEAA